MKKYLPVYSGKHMVKGLLEIFSSKRSFLLRNRIIEVSTNHLLLHIESNSFIDSIILFISSSSAKTRSYPTKRKLNVSACVLGEWQIIICITISVCGGVCVDLGYRVRTGFSNNIFHDNILFFQDKFTTQIHS